jgi:hypothetical protein
MTSTGRSTDMNPTIDDSETRELAVRRSDGLEVRLLRHPNDSDVLVEVLDERRKEHLEFAVPAHRALDAFRHPFAYAVLAGARDHAHELAGITF